MPELIRPGAVAESELQHLRLALESARLGTFDYDLERRHVRLSTRACEIYGIAECSEASLDEVLRHASPEGLQARARALRVALEDERNATYEVVYELHPPHGNDTSRLTLGKISLRTEPVRLLDVLTLATESVLTPAIRGARTVQTDLAAQPIWVNGDADRLNQMISNLLQNAVKFSRPGGHIGLRLERSGKEALISVLDDGQGIAPHLLPVVFDLFVQGDDSLDRQSGGLGIGLSLVRALAELHGGSVSADSEGVGRGACFTLRLPLVSEPEAQHAEPASGGSGLDRILIVEDNVDAAETLQAMLQLQGHEVWVAHDGHAGLAHAHELAPNVMLVDIGLPGLSGLELARRLRAELKVQPRRLVALTGYGTPKDRRESLEAGFDLHLVKPVTFEVLAQALADPAAASTPA